MTYRLSNEWRILTHTHIAGPQNVTVGTGTLVGAHGVLAGTVRGVTGGIGTLVNICKTSSKHTQVSDVILHPMGISLHTQVQHGKIPII